MKIRVTTDSFNYQGLPRDSSHEVGHYFQKTDDSLATYLFNHNGKEWILSSEQCEELDALQAESKSDSALDKQEGGGHYKGLKIQPIEYIHANGLSYLQGNVVKYVSRYKDKNGAEDLKKAIHYLELILELEYGIK